MKLVAQLFLFVFITFLATPTIISAIQKGVNTSMCYNLSEEEKEHTEVKAVFSFDFTNTFIHIPKNTASSLIHSKKLSKHNKIASQIIIPPPEKI